MKPALKRHERAPYHISIACIMEMMVGCARLMGAPHFDPYAYEVHEDPYPDLRAAARRGAGVPQRGAAASGRCRGTPTCSPASATRSASRAATASRSTLDAFHENARRRCRSSRWTRRATIGCARWSRAASRRAASRSSSRACARWRRATSIAASSATDCDFIRDFAGKLPMDVISEMLGVPEADRATLRTWADSSCTARKACRACRRRPRSRRRCACSTTSREMIAGSQEASAGRSHRRAARRRDRRRPPLRPRDHRLPVPDGRSPATRRRRSCSATRSTGCGAIPSERDRLRADPTLVPRWVEETLRYDNSTQALARARRAATSSCTARSCARAIASCCWSARATATSASSRDPDRYDLLRDTSASLAFGQGVHFCLGASLARLEGRVALEEVWKRIPRLRDRPGRARARALGQRARLLGAADRDLRSRR